jgi:hypothetical protein
MLLSMKKLLGIVVLCLLSSKAIAFTSPTLTSELEINSYDSTPRGLAFNNDGTKFFTTSFGNKEINAFKLNTAWDLSTAVHLYAHTIGYNGRHLAFNSDGTQLFFLEGKVSNNASVDRVYRYTLSTPFDVRTRTYNDNFVDVSSQQTATSGLEFSPDGKKMYIIGTVGAKINQYTLSTAWDLTTAVHGGSFGFEDSSGDDEPLHATFNYDGTKMWMTGWIEDSIFEYNLSSAWDVTTADLVGSFDIGTFDDGPSALVFSQDASKLFVLAATGDKVGEYKLYCTYGILACRDPTSDKDDVASVESQTESAKQLIQHTTYPVLNRMEWLRRNSNSGNLTNQNIKFQFSNEILASLSNLIIPTYLNNEETTSELKASNWSFWSEGTVSIGKIGDSLSSSAKNINTTAITIGADKKTDNGRMSGVALRFGNDDIDFGNVKNSLGIDAVSLTLYESRLLGEDKFIDSLIGIGSFKTDIVNAVGSTSTEGTRDGKQIFSSFKIRETFKKNELNITPKIKLDLGFTSLSDYSENGSTNLKFDRQNIGTIITSIGGAVDSSSNLRSGTFKPYFEYDYFLDISPSSEQKISYISDTSSTYTLTNINSSTHNFKSKLGFDFITHSGWDFTSSYQRTQSKENGYSDALYFGANYISRRNIEYAMSLDNNKAFLDYKRNINGFDITFGSNYTLMSATPDYGANLEISNKF